MKSKVLFPVLAVAVFSAFTLSGEVLGSDLIQQCDSCHGKDGASSNPEYPVIGGLSEFFIEETMFIYQDGARPCVESKYLEGPDKGKTTDMCKIANEMSEADIKKVAAHYSALPFAPVTQPFDPAMAEVGATLHERHCEKCHAAAGSDPMDDAGLLAGQHTEYLRESLAHFMADERESDEKMLEKLAELSEEDIEALLHYYASKKDLYSQ